MTGISVSLARNAYHPDSGYFPWFLKEEYYILTGTCLGNQFKTEGLETNWVLIGDTWIILTSRQVFASRRAIQQDGSPANLKYIDFVKVHTAQMGQGAAVGEVSTESSAAIDLRLKAKNRTKNKRIMNKNILWGFFSHAFFYYRL